MRVLLLSPCFAVIGAGACSDNEDSAAPQLFGRLLPARLSKRALLVLLVLLMLLLLLLLLSSLLVL